MALMVGALCSHGWSAGCVQCALREIRVGEESTYMDMKKRVTAVVLLVAILGLVTMPSAFAQPVQQTGGLTIPITGTFTDALGGVGRFVGNLNIQRFAVSNNQVVAVGTLTGTLTDSLPRALCWAAAWDMVRTAETPARDFVAMVLGGIDSETDIGVVETLQANVVTALTYYVDPAAATAPAHQPCRECRTLVLFQVRQLLPALAGGSRRSRGAVAGSAGASGHPARGDLLLYL